MASLDTVSSIRHSMFIVPRSILTLFWVYRSFKMHMADTASQAVSYCDETLVSNDAGAGGRIRIYGRPIEKRQLQRPPDIIVNHTIQFVCSILGVSASVVGNQP